MNRRIRKKRKKRFNGSYQQYKIIKRYEKAWLEFHYRLTALSNIHLDLTIREIPERIPIELLFSNNKYDNGTDNSILDYLKEQMNQ